MYFGNIQDDFVTVTYKFPKENFLTIEELTSSLSALNALFSNAFYDENGEIIESILVIDSIEMGSLKAKIRKVIRKGLKVAKRNLPILVGTTGITLISSVGILNDFFDLTKHINDMIKGDFFQEEKKDAPKIDSSKFANFENFIKPTIINQNHSIIIQHHGDEDIIISNEMAVRWSEKYRNFMKPQKAPKSLYKSQTMIISRVGQKYFGRIENISREDLILLFDEAIPVNNVVSNQNQNHNVFIVDVEIGTMNHKPITYKIVRYHESFTM